MRKCTLDLGIRLTPPGSTIVDLGCSTGEGLGQFVDVLGVRNRYLGIDASEPMIEAARQRFERELQNGWVELSHKDLHERYPEVDTGLALCILTMQFMPIEQRGPLLRQVVERTVSGGAMILVEKIVGATDGIGHHMTGLYHDLKRSAGYTEEEVERKRLSLEGILVPVTARRNEELLYDAGFRQIDCFWRWMNFAGWVALK